MLRTSGVAATFVVAALSAVVAAIGFGAHAGAIAAGTLPGAVPALTLTWAITPLSAPFCALLAILATAVAIWCVRRGAIR